MTNPQGKGGQICLLTTPTTEKMQNSFFSFSYVLFPNEMFRFEKMIGMPMRKTIIRFRFRYWLLNQNTHTSHAPFIRGFCNFCFFFLFDDNNQIGRISRFSYAEIITFGVKSIFIKFTIISYTHTFYLKWENRPKDF